MTPFVYRRYLDYGVFEGLRQLHRRIREEAQRRAAGRPERANDVKLSRGGIREIEFIVQLLLVVRGGQFPEIRTRSTLRGLQRLVAHGLMAADTASRLSDAYTLLRRLEHRIQYLDDQQTHVLPTADADLTWIARSLGDTSDGGARHLLDQLGSAREFVANEFDALLHDGQAPVPANRAAGGCKSCGQAALPIDALGEHADAASRAGAACERLVGPGAGARPARRNQAAPGARGATRRGLCGRWVVHRRGRASLRRLAGAAAAARVVRGAARRAARGARSVCCGCSAWRAGRCST